MHRSVTIPLVLFLLVTFPTSALPQVESQVDGTFARVEDLDKKDFKTLLAQAQSGVPQAQFEVAMAYSSGSGAKKNFVEAAKMFRTAAEQGFAPAEWVLGLFYRDGRGVPKDVPQAVTWFLKAAEQGLPGAEYDLGVTYSLGEGIPADYARAKSWLEKAAKSGHFEAQTNLGTMYFEGTAMPKDYVKAYAWWLLASRGDVKAEDLKRNLLALAQPVPGDRLNALEARMLAYQWLTQEKVEISPATSLVLDEVPRREKVQGKTMIGYDIKASGFPRGKSFDIWTWRVDQKPKILWRGFTSDESGKLRCSPPPNISAKSYSSSWCRGDLEELHMVLIGYRRGEVFKVGAISTDGTLRTQTEAVPLPIEATQGTCHLSSKLLSGMGDIFAVSASGFAPNEEVSVRVAGQSYKIPSSSEGNFGEIIFMPGEESGIEHYLAVAKSCNVDLAFSRGKAALEVQ
jgi:Sel1 repeat